MSDAQQTSQVTVSVEGVGYTLRGKVVLERADLEARPGEVTAVVGAPGSGRSTLVRIICSGLQPTAGRVRIGRYDPVTDPPSVRALVGVTVEDLGAWESMSCAEVLDTLAAGHRIPRRTRRARVAEVLELVGLSGSAETHINELELAGQRRLGLAGALLHEPPVLLLDGLTAGLDPGTRQSLLRLVRELADAGRTVLVTGSDLADFFDVADTAILLAGGRTSTAQPMTEVTEDGRRVRPWLIRSLDQRKLSQALSRLGLSSTGHGSDGALIRLADDAEAADLTAALAGYAVPLVALQPLVPAQQQPSPGRSIVGPRTPAEESR